MATTNLAVPDVSWRDLWDSAMTIDHYVGQMWRKNRARFLRNRDRTPVSNDALGQFAEHKLRIIVLTEHYCDDSAQLLPMLWRLADTVSDLDIRILRQHEHPAIANRYTTKGGYPAIPVFIVLDAQLRMHGALIERPAHVSAELEAETRRFQRAHTELPGINRTLERMPEATRTALKHHIERWREARHERWASYLFEELATLAACSAVGGM